MLYNFIIKNFILSISILVLIILLLFFELYEFIYSKNAISTDKAIELINRKNAVIIDIRNESDFKVCSIINSINIPYDKFKNNINFVKKYEKKIIILVYNENRSTQKLINDIKSNKINQIFYIKDGLTAWNKNELPTRKG